ncbi:MAG: hypothetical protein RLY31_1338 [Bacteroidota bacterium]|jgi:hypothetical protein
MTSKHLTCLALAAAGILLAAGCEQAPPAAGASTGEIPDATGVAVPDQLPSIPLSVLEDIYQRGTQADYIFYDHPFTLSLSEQPSIQYSIRHIAEDSAPMKPGCRPAGHISYQISGNIVLEGDFYFSQGCTYFVFTEGQQPKYANYMTDEGIQYFNNQIQQALRLRQGMQ